MTEPTALGLPLPPAEIDMRPNPEHHAQAR